MRAWVYTYYRKYEVPESAEPDPAELEQLTSTSIYQNWDKTRVRRKPSRTKKVAKKRTPGLKKH